MIVSKHDTPRLVKVLLVPSCSQKPRKPAPHEGWSHDQGQALDPRAQEAPRDAGSSRRATAAMRAGHYRTAKEAVLKADQYRYRDRKNRKRDFRRLWIYVRINAAARQHGMSYSQFMHGLQLAGVELDRKILADIAVRDADTFRRFADRAREALAAG